MIRASTVSCFFVLALAAQDAPQSPVAPERQFDFWVGEWHVNNRKLGAGGYQDAGSAKARIRPILDGRAILEEWDGQPDGGHAQTFGISVRYFDPGTRRWVIALNWPNPQQAAFSRMEGSFRHGRAEFFPPPAFEQTPPRMTRFTFSDALPTTVRWDMAQPVEGGAWLTNWIMEFSRTRSIADTVADGEPIRTPPKPADCVCKAEGARQFDAFVGAWAGRGRQLVGGREGGVTAKLRITSANRGCATMCFLDVYRENAAGEVARRSFEAWAFHTQAKKWVARAMTDEEPEFQVLVGQFADGNEGQFVRTDREGMVRQHSRRITYSPGGDGGIVVRHEASDDAGETWQLELELELQKSR